MADKVAESAQGKLSFGGNELNCDSLPSNPDPSGVRVGSSIDHAHGCGGGGKFSFDALPFGPDGPRHEMVMLHGEQDQAVRGNDGNPAGALSGHFNRGGESDADMVKGFEMTATRLWFNPDWIACLRGQLGDSGGGTGSNMRSPQGRMSMELQEDGNLVVYDTSVQPWKAVWSIWTGLIP